MTQRADFDKIELHLIRVLHTLITERSVSRAALRLQSTQPAVSAQLKRLRELTGDPLLVRAGNGMTPTATALRLLTPAVAILQSADAMFNPRARATAFEPSSSNALFRVAASDYLDPEFLPMLVAHLKKLSPDLRVHFVPLSRDLDYRRALADGEVDLVIGNWLRPPAELHLGRLISDEIVCLVAADHPLVGVANTRGWTVERYISCDHIAPEQFHPGAEGVIEDHLSALGLKRRRSVQCAYFGVIPSMVAQTRLVLTTGRQYCSRFVDSLPVRIIRCPVPFPPLRYYQLWHDLTQSSPGMRWFREQVREVARRLLAEGSGTTLVQDRA